MSKDYQEPLRYIRNHVWKPHHRRTTPAPTAPLSSSVVFSRSTPSTSSVPFRTSPTVNAGSHNAVGAGVNRRQEEG